MGEIVIVSPDTLSAALEGAGPGTTLDLSPGIYTEPVSLIGKKGKREAPIVIRASIGAIFDGETTFDDFTPRAEQVAKAARDAGQYPGLYDIAGEAMVKLVECEWVHLENLSIRRAWPTAIYLNNSTHVTISKARIRDGTFAIYAEGEQTGDLLIEDCHWLQDTSRTRLWRVVGWDAVHGNEPTSGGARAFDGAFFRTRTILGDVVVRRNLVQHACNGIHMFNYKREKEVPGLNNNVRIYGNRFEYIRDNVIEPERWAVNWWIYDNEIYNAHKWFSLQMYRSGFFYIFGNRGWFDEMPGPANDRYTGGAVFKLQKRVERPVGPTFVFNNSWYLRSSYIKKNRTSAFRHWNNAISYCHPSAHGALMCHPRKPFFGPGATAPPSKPINEKEQFTIEWKALDIEFDNDLVHHWDFPDGLREKGYDITNGLPGDPMFLDPQNGDFGLRRNSPCIGAAREVVVSLPDGDQWLVSPGADIGAVQYDGKITAPPFIRYVAPVR